jgi:chromosome segregation ATPase
MTESDFHVLKKEQRLLVDLVQFPEMVRQLIHLPSVSIVLTESAPGESLLSVNEASQFRELTHLCLKLKRGSDESVKSHLASRLGALKSTSDELRHKLDEVKREKSKLVSDRDMCVSELSRLRIDTDAAVAAIQATCRAQLAELQEDHAKEIRNMHVSSSNEYNCETRRLFDDLREKDFRNRELEKRLDDMRVAIETEARRNADLEHKLVQRDLERKEYERRIQQLTADMSAVRKEVSVDASRELERSIEKRDSTIAKLQVKNKELKLVLKETQNALVEQEKVVERLTRELSEARTKITLSNSLQDELSRMQAKLADSESLIDSNSKVISYLNQQLVNTSSCGPGRLGLPSPINTPSLLVPEYPNRSVLYTKEPEASGYLDRGSLSATSPVVRNLKGPVKFTARIGSKEPLVK